MLIDSIYYLLKDVNAKTYPGVTDQEVEAPFIVHSIARTIPSPSKDGVSIKDLIIYKIATYDTTQNGAKVHADEVRAYIDEYRGEVLNLNIDKIRFADEETGFDQEAELYYALQTYRIWVNYIT